MTQKQSYLAGLGLIVGSLLGCAPLPPSRTVPLTPPPSDSAVVVFVRQDTTTERLDVFDERGELLGRLSEHSWFAVERPAGRQIFIAANQLTNCATGGSTDVGALWAELEAGQAYIVRVTTFTVPFSTSEHLNFRCCYPSDGLEVRHVELVGVRPGGAEWVRAARILDHGTAYQAAPRGLEPFGGVSERYVEMARARFQNGCINRDRSRLETHHGASDYPTLDE